MDLLSTETHSSCLLPPAWKQGLHLPRHGGNEHARGVSLFRSIVNVVSIVMTGLAAVLLLAFTAAAKADSGKPTLVTKATNRR